MNKILSVIVPSYNMEGYLRQCLESLIVPDSELLQKLDVIVVNDGSKDRTSEIAHSYETKYPGVFRVIDKKNGHYGSCVNAAIPLAYGEYIRLVDADDWVDTENFCRYVNLLTMDTDAGGRQQVDLVLTDSLKINEKGEAFDVATQPFAPWSVFEFKVFAEMCSRGYYPAMTGITYRRSLLGMVSYRQSEGIAYSDGEWIAYPMMGVSTIKYMPLSIYRYRWGREGQSISEVERKKNWQADEVMSRADFKWAHKHLYKFDAVHKGYYLEWRMGRLWGVYRKGILGAKPGSEIERSLRKFDNDLEGLDKATFDMIATAKWPSRFGLPYIRFWRSDGVFNKWKLMFVRLLVKSGLRKFILKIFGR